MNNHYACINGNILPKQEISLSINNRSFRYGDGLFESIRVFNQKIPFLKYHFQRLQKGIQLLQLKPPSDFDLSFLQKKIQQLLQKNQLQNARLRLLVFRAEGGLYTPTNHQLHYLIEMDALSEDHFTLSQNGLKIGLYPTFKKNISPLSTIKSTNSLLYVLASIYKKENQLDDCLLLNTDDYIIESSNSNLFLWSKNQLLTPSLSQACLDGVMRRVILEIAKSKKIAITEKPLTKADLHEAEEIFLTNAIQGIRWVYQFEKKHYNCKHIPQLLVYINEFIH